LKKFLVIVVVLGAIGTGAWFYTKKHADPSVPFTKTTRETISNVLSTNGKVEPIEYIEIRAEAQGMIRKLAVRAGDTVSMGQILADVTDPALQQEIEAAEAREAQIRAEIGTLEAGGRSADFAEIDGSVARLTTDREAAQRNVDSLTRLVDKQAATAYELQQAKQAVVTIDAQIAALKQKRGAFITRGDLTGAQARLREAQANAESVRARLKLYSIVAPMAGVIYDLPARAGTFLHPGDAVASVGRLDPVRVRVYVDEPELGRVAAGRKVRLTWDALPGREWNGTVEKLPTQIVALGTRQVGEVLCTIANPKRELVPGTNVNAFILTQVVENALTIPKAAVRRDGGIGVFVLQADSTLKWQPVKTGASDALRVEVVDGLKDGDAVAEATAGSLTNGMKVTAVVK